MSTNLKVYCINLEEEKEKKQRISDLIRKEGFEKDTLFFNAIHYSEINEQFLKENDLKVFVEWFLEGTNLEFYARDIKSGEIGCGASHYFCWKNFAESGAKYGLFFEDDNYWEEQGTVKKVVKDFISFNKDYGADLFYLSRIIPHIDNCSGLKTVEEANEEVVTRDVDYNYVIPTYSYNLNAYVLSREGVKKVLEQKPNHSIMTPDEIIPAMYFKDMHKRHPNIAKRFKPTLKALALDGPVLDGRFVGVCTQAGGEGMTSSTVDSSKEYKG